MLSMALPRQLCVPVVLALFTIGSFASEPSPPRICVADNQRAVDETSIKWNPGHYMIAPNGSTLSDRLRYLDELAREPAVKGMQVRYYWKELEPELGQYDFTALGQLLDKASSVNKQLIVEIWTRSYAGTYKPSPDYIQSSEYGGGDYSTHGDGTRFGTRIWNASVTDRLIALYGELGRRYNSHSSLEAVSTMETALGPSVRDLPDYSVAAATNKSILLVNDAKTAFPNTIVRHAVNFWSDRDEFIRLHENAPGNMIGLGGPDVGAGRTAREIKGSQQILVGEVGGSDYRGLVPIMFSAEQSDTSRFPPATIYEKAVGDLKTSHLSWLRNNWAGPADHRWSTGILPFIRSIDGQIINTDCPEALLNRCSTSLGPQP